MHRIVFICALLLAAATATAGDQDTPLAPAGKKIATHLLPPEIVRIKERGKLIVAMRPDSGPPLCSIADDGKLHGIEMDIATELAKKLGVELEINATAITPEDALELVRNRTADLAVANLSRTANRTLTTPFGLPYLGTHATFLARDTVVADDNGYIDKSLVMEKLNQEGIRIGVQQGAYHEELLEAIAPLATAVPVPGDWERVVNLYFDGEVDALLMEDLRALVMFRQSPQLTVMNSLFVLEDREEAICPAFHWEDDNLRLWYDAWIREWRPRPYDIETILVEFPALFKR
jgi:ABC-type amino acid transport/signal transduction systems, periplasmic component/domain